MAQFVVMSGKNISKVLNKPGEKSFILILTHCTVSRRFIKIMDPDFFVDNKEV